MEQCDVEGLIFEIAIFPFAATTESINALLAEKSRENSELQIILSEKSIQFESELESLQNLTDRLQAENTDLKQQVEQEEKELEQRFNREMKVTNSHLK